MNDVFKGKFLVVDNIHLLQVNNLQQRVNQAVKYPEPEIGVRDQCGWDLNAKLYFYTITEPDSEGDIHRHWGNHRWTEVSSTARTTGIETATSRRGGCRPILIPRDDITRN